MSFALTMFVRTFLVQFRTVTSGAPSLREVPRKKARRCLVLPLTLSLNWNFSRYTMEETVSSIVKNV